MATVLPLRLGIRTPPPLVTGGVIVGIGDSISLGLGASNTSYIDIMQAANPLITTIHYAAHSGEGWNYNSGGTVGGTTLTSRAAAEVDIYVGVSPQPFLFMFAGTNDISYGATGAATYTAFETYVQARISAGWSVNKMVVLTMISRTTLSNAERLDYNSRLVGGVSTYGYHISRVDLDPFMGCTSCYSDTTYFGDGVHPTSAGQQILATITTAVT